MRDRFIMIARLEIYAKSQSDAIANLEKRCKERIEADNSSEKNPLYIRTIEIKQVTVSAPNEV